MKTLTVAALLCAVMALTTAAGEHHVVERSTSCPGGWRRINGRCFLYVPQQLNWAQAERNCQSMGANLASVHQDAEIQGIRRMIVEATRRNTEAWLGGHDSAVLGVWLWSDGTRFGFTFWCRRPNNPQRQTHCTTINNRGLPCWKDQLCTPGRPSVCARNI